MGIKNKFLFFFCISVITPICSQQKNIERSLKEVFLIIEEKFDVKFNYIEKDIASKKAIIRDEDLILDEMLKELKIQTQLIYKKIDRRYIVVQAKKKVEGIKVCGFLYDEMAGEPLMEATVVNEDGSSLTVTDKNGYFEIENIDKNDSLSISFIGYETRSIKVSKLEKKSCAKIFLNEITSILDEILLTSYLTEGMVKKADGSEVFVPKRLGILPGLIEPDVLQSLQLLPGVLSPDETAAGIHIRGGTPDQNLILFDGIKIYNSAHFFGMISAFNPYFSKSIKVFRSGASVDYGNHISGVIDIKSDVNLATKFSGSFGTNLIHADAFVKFPISKKVTVMASARRSFSDVFSTITFNNISNRIFQNTIIRKGSERIGAKFNESYKDFFYTDLNTKIIYDLNENNKLRFNFLFNKNKLDHSLSSENEPVTSISNSLNFFNSGLSLEWNKKWSDKVTQYSKLYYSDFDLDYLLSVEQATNLEFPILKKNKVKEVSFHSNVNIKWSDRKEIRLGYEYTNSGTSFNLESNNLVINPLGGVGEREKSSRAKNNNTHTLFGKFEYKREDKLKIDIGARINYFSLSNNTFLSPRFYIQQKLGSSFWVRASAEKKRQNVSQLVDPFTEVFGLLREVWLLSDGEEVPVLESNQVTFGFTFKRSNWTVDVDAYLKDIDGLTSASRGFLSNVNGFLQGNSVSKGIDVFIKKKWGNYNSSISYSLSNKEFTFMSEDGSLSSTFPGNYDIENQFLWTNNYKLNGFDFSVGWTFRNGIPYTEVANYDEQNNIINYEEINSSRLPSYHKLDFSATYKFKFNKEWRGKVGLSFLNVYNQKNIINRSYGREVKNNRTILVRTDSYSLGFTPNVVFRVNF